MARMTLRVGILLFLLTFFVALWQLGFWKSSSTTPAPLRAAARALRALTPNFEHFAPTPAQPERKAPTRSAERIQGDDSSTVATEDEGQPLSEQPVPASVEVDFGAEPGQVAQVHNESGETLNVRVTATHPVTHQSSTVEVSVPPYESTNLIQAGLVIERGDDVTISSPPYRDQLSHLR